jgi:hypothetical protein
MAIGMIPMMAIVELAAIAMVDAVAGVVVIKQYKINALFPKTSYNYILLTC